MAVNLQAAQIEGLDWLQSNPMRCLLLRFLQSWRNCRELIAPGKCRSRHSLMIITHYQLYKAAWLQQPTVPPC